ncbi:MAG: hypothetical protein EOP61_37830, partial [Sphingomonadales bacterium]
MSSDETTRDSGKSGWSDRLFGGFRQTSERLSGNLAGIVAKTKLDDAQLDEIEDALVMSDLGPRAAARIRERLAEHRFGREDDHNAIMEVVARKGDYVQRLGHGPQNLGDFLRHHFHDCIVIV